MKNKNEILNEFQIINNNFQSGNFIETISKSKKLLHILPNNEFLNNRQLDECSKVVRESPDSIYRPNLENEEISDEEFELEEKASEILDNIYVGALEFVEDKLWDYDFFEGFSE